MITKEEAYVIIKKRSDQPVTYMLETDHFYASTADACLLIDKLSGAVEDSLYYPPHFLAVINGGKHVVLDTLFEDFLNYYRNKSADASLAELYALAWNRLFYHQEEDPDMFKNEEERKEILSRWSGIVRILYSDIRKRIEAEDLFCPPCVQDNPGDPFYMAKPFMLKNGWTTNYVRRTWVKG